MLNKFNLDAYCRVLIDKSNNEPIDINFDNYVNTATTVYFYVIDKVVKYDVIWIYGDFIDYRTLVRHSNDHIVVNAEKLKSQM